MFLEDGQPARLGEQEFIEAREFANHVPGGEIAQDAFFAGTPHLRGHIRIAQEVADSIGSGSVILGIHEESRGPFKHCFGIAAYACDYAW